MFCGFFDEGSDVVLHVVTDDVNRKPVNPDAAPTFRAFGVSGQLPSGSGAATQEEAGSVTGATNASPIVVTAVGSNLPTNAYVTVSGVGGNTNANTTALVTAVDADHFSLQGTTGNGSYTSGGSWKTVGLYKVTLTGSVLTALEAGRTYTVVVTWLVSGTPAQKTLTFTVQ